jgi:hypothetical protein
MITDLVAAVVGFALEVTYQRFGPRYVRHASRELRVFLAAWWAVFTGIACTLGLLYGLPPSFMWMFCGSFLGSVFWMWWDDDDRRDRRKRRLQHASARLAELAGVMRELGHRQPLPGGAA